MNAATLTPRDASNPIVTRVWPVLHKGALGIRMIPTIRSMLAAMLLTVTVLIGGFGLFAAFRVNHEPLARLPVAATQFQFASIDAAPRPLSFASDPPHLESNEALRAVVTAISAHDPDQAEVAAASDKATDNAAPERVATGSVPPGMAAAQSPNNPDSSSAPTDAVAAAAPETAPPQSTNVATVTAAETEQLQTVQAPATEVTPPATAIAAAQSPGPSKPDAATDMTGSITEMPPQEAAALTAASQAILAEPEETARQIANRKRLAALRRARKARAAALAQAANQTSGFGQANFPSGSGFQSAQAGLGGPLVSPPSAARRQN